MAKMSEIDSDRQRIERLTDVVRPPTFAESARSAASVWRDMNSAPRDGTFFLARYRLVSDEEDEDGRVIKRGVVEHFTVVAYFVLGGFVEFPWRGSFVQNLTWTKWQPLPAPPAGER